jgi:uncharacterized protein
MILIPLARLEEAALKLEGTEAPEFLEIGADELISFSEPVSYQLNASMVNGGVLVLGQVATVMNAVCGRCLEKFAVEIKNDEICHFYEDVQGQELDITNDIREDILIVIPANPLCDENCKGLCHTCGANLNNETCKCDSGNDDDNIWKELDNLKF